MGVLICITGKGKGKSTSCFGMVERTLGHGGKVAVIQFIKSNYMNTGEYKAITSQGVLWKGFGEGFINRNNEEQTKKDCIEGFEYFRTLLESGEYDLIVLDEFTYTLHFGFLDETEVCEYLKTVKNSKTNVIVSGRYATDRLIDVCDTVSELNDIKHHSRTRGMKAVKMVEW